MVLRVVCAALVLGLAAGAQIYDIEYPTKELTTPGGVYMPYGPCSSGYIIGYLTVTNQEFIQQCLVSGEAIIVDDKGNPSHVQFEHKEGQFDVASDVCTFDVAGTTFMTNGAILDNNFLGTSTWVQSDDCFQEAIIHNKDETSPATRTSAFWYQPRVVGKLKIKQQRNGNMKFWYTLALCAGEDGFRDESWPWYHQTYCNLISIQGNKPGPMNPFMQAYNSSQQLDADVGYAFLYNQGRKKGFRNKKKWAQKTRYGPPMGVMIQSGTDDSMNGGDTIIAEAYFLDSPSINGISLNDEVINYATTFERVEDNKKSIVKRKKIKDWTGGRKVDGKWVYPNQP